jgi:hypothetical protein
LDKLLELKPSTRPSIVLLLINFISAAELGGGTFSGELKLFLP